MQQDDLSIYTLILLIGPTCLRTLKHISNSAWKQSTPLFYVHSVAFYSQITIQLPNPFPIVDTHPDPASTQDLRLLKPWPDLHEYAKKHTHGLNQMTDHDHGHVPYLLLLLHYLEIWKRDHDGKLPENYKEKTAFRDLVRAGARTNNSEGGEENFDEAVGAVLKSLNLSSVPSGFTAIVALPECQGPTKTVSARPSRPVSKLT